MSEHKIAQDNIDIDVDVSSNVSDDNALNTSSDDMLETSRRLKRLKTKLSKTMRVKAAILKALKLKTLKKTIYRY